MLLVSRESDGRPPSCAVGYKRGCALTKDRAHILSASFFMLRCLTATEPILILGRAGRPVAEVLPPKACSPLLLPGSGVVRVPAEIEPALLSELPLGSPLFLLAQVATQQNQTVGQGHLTQEFAVCWRQYLSTKNRVCNMCVVCMCAQI